MVGYSEVVKGYRLLDVKNPRRTIVARNVVFIESAKPTIEDARESEEAEATEEDIEPMQIATGSSEGNDIQKNIEEDQAISEDSEYIRK